MLHAEVVIAELLPRLISRIQGGSQSVTDLRLHTCSPLAGLPVQRRNNLRLQRGKIRSGLLQDRSYNSSFLPKQLEKHVRGPELRMAEADASCLADWARK